MVQQTAIVASCFIHIISRLCTVGSAVVSWLVCSSPDQAVQVQAQARDTVLFLGKTPNSHSASLAMGTGKFLGKLNKLWGSDLGWTSILSRGSRNTPSCFMLQKPGEALTAMTQSAPRLDMYSV